MAVGSALANVVAQTVSGMLFLRALLIEGVERRLRTKLVLQQLRSGWILLVRSLVFQACFIPAAAVAARFGPAALGAHQITLQLWLFCTLMLESIGVAAQSLIGAELGAGRAEDARRTALRVAGLGGVSGAALALAIWGIGHRLPGWFIHDVAVLEQVAITWPWFACMQPLAGVVFALDGVLLGAGDVGFLRNLTLAAALAGFLPAIWLTHELHLGIGGIWAGLTLFIMLRLGLMVARLVSRRWATVGPAR